MTTLLDADQSYRKMGAEPDLGNGLQHDRHPMAVGITFRTGFVMTPSVGAVLMSASTVIVAINTQFLRFYRRHK